MVNGVEGTQSGSGASNLEVIVNVWERDNRGLKRGGGTGNGEKQMDSETT